MILKVLILLIPLTVLSAEYDLQDHDWLYEIKKEDTINGIVKKTSGPYLEDKDISEYIRKIKNFNLQISDWKNLKEGNELDLYVLKSTYKEVIKVKSKDKPDFYTPMYKIEAFYTVSSATFKESFDEFSVQGDKISVLGYGLSGTFATSHDPSHFRFSGTYTSLDYNNFEVSDFHFNVMDFSHFENLNFYYTYRFRGLNFKSLSFTQAVQVKENAMHFVGAGAQFYFYFFDRKVQLDSSANVLVLSVNNEDEKESFGSIVDFTASYSPVNHFEASAFIDFLYLNGGGRVNRTLLLGVNLKLYFEI